ncbi:MAG: hypothetical protein IJK81_06850 [Selenomonadaceae bacterium]|nr:hypothetical protein [Selenomonadaceae bacterium]
MNHYMLGNIQINLDYGIRFWDDCKVIYGDDGEGDDLFIHLNSVEKVTLTGGEGNDTFWFIESASVSISGGAGKNVYRFDPYRYGTERYHNDVIITDISNDDTIRLDEYETDGSGLTWR